MLVLSTRGSKFPRTFGPASSRTVTTSVPEGLLLGEAMELLDGREGVEVEPDGGEPY